jgi:O-antigen/teichoic acid export membrane protein
MCVFFLRFVRTMILSHLLSPNDLGAAVALMSILAGCELITDVGLDRFVIVTDGKDRAQAVAVARQLALGRAILLAAAIAIFSPALARLFGASEHLRGIAWLGLVPLISSFRNWRMVQIQQDYRYGPEAIANVGGQVAAVIVVIPACAWFHDERALLVSLITEAVVHVALSRVLVQPERVAAVDPSVRRAAIKWGVPLLINGVGLMALGQLDRVIVANLFDLQTLALYALGLNLAITPTSPLATIAQKIGLPFLGNLRESPQALRQASLLVLVGMACVAAAYALPIGLALDRLVPFFYGRQYQVTETFCALAMFDAFLRFCRGGPNMILLHHSFTSRLTVGNLIAGVGMLIGLALGVASRRLESVMVGLVIGDFLSLVVLLSLLHRHLSIPTALTHIGLLATTIGLAAAMLWAGGDLTLGERALIFMAGGLAIGIDAIVLYQQVGRGVATRSHQSRQRIARNVIPVPGCAVLATVAIESEPPTPP